MGKGGARAVFDGLKKSQADALEFVNVLTGFKFPHTYDRVMAGTVAWISVYSFRSPYTVRTITGGQYTLAPFSI